MDGATGDKEVTLDISQYLPEGVYLSDESSKRGEGCHQGGALWRAGHLSLNQPD